MSEPQRDDLLQRLRSLERSHRVWKTLAIVSTATLALLLFLGIALSVVPQQRARAAQEQAARAMQQIEAQRDHAEQLRRDAEKAKQAEQKARDLL